MTTTTKPLNVFKLTDQNHMTRNNTQWGPNITHTAKGISRQLANNSWLHFYTNPTIAVLLNPVHGKFQNPILWTAKAEGKILLDQDIKGGCTKLTTINPIPLPIITDKQRVEFAARLALQTITHPAYPYRLAAWLQQIAEQKPTTREHFHEFPTQAPYYRYSDVVRYIAECICSQDQDFSHNLQVACSQTIITASRRLPNTLTTTTHNFFQGQNP